MNRRILALLLAVAMVLTFAACKKNEIPEETVPGIVLTPEENDGDLDNTPVETTESEATEVAEATEAEEETAAPEETKGEQKNESAQNPTEAETETTAPTTAPSAPAVQMTDYERYNAMSGEEQMAFMESFDSIEAFFAWYNNAKAEHEEQHPDIEIGDGVIDLGDLAGGNG